MRLRHLPAALLLVSFLRCGVGGTGVPPVGGAADPEERRAVGKSLAPAGMLLQREAADKPWKAVAPQEAVFSRDLLLALPGGRAVLKSGDGAVQLELWGNLPELSPYPVLESAVVLHANPDFALDFTLDRGRVVLTNQRDKGAARVRIRAHGETWDVNLAEPGASLALDLYGRWPRGVPFNPDPKAVEKPMASLGFFVLKGNVDLKAGAQQHSLKAPPGPAYFHWSSVTGHDAGPQRQEKLPAWTEPPPALVNLEVQHTLDEFARRFKDKSASEALVELRNAARRLSDEKQAHLLRNFAVMGLAALDDLPRLTGLLEDPKAGEARGLVVEALRHWIGRAPGQDLALYNFLIEQRKYPKAQAETVLQLLHSPGEQELNRPITYDVLLAYLGHEQLAIRELARWQLERILPGARKVGFDAAAPAEQRQKAIRELRKLVQETLKKPKPEK
jgi:hypothetical protein